MAKVIKVERHKPASQDRAVKVYRRKLKEAQRYATRARAENKVGHPVGVLKNAVMAQGALSEAESAAYVGGLIVDADEYYFTVWDAVNAAYDLAANYVALTAEQKRAGGLVSWGLKPKRKKGKKNPDSRAVLRRAMRGT